MWILFALGSAFFAGLTSVVAKCGIKKTDSTVATAIRTGVVLICSAVMVNSEMLFPQTVRSLAITCGSSKVVPEVKSFFMNDALPVPER